MTGNEIRAHLEKKIARSLKNWNGAVPESLTRILNHEYNHVEFIRQGNFTLAILASTNHPEFPVPYLYGMSKRNASCDPENTDLGRRVALNAIVDNEISKANNP